MYVWRVSYVEGEAGRSLGGYARGEGTRAYLVYEDSATGRAEAEAGAKDGPKDGLGGLDGFYIARLVKRS